MSLLYQQASRLTVQVTDAGAGKLNITFISDCGKFGTDEILQSYELSPLELMTALEKGADDDV